MFQKFLTLFQDLKNILLCSIIRYSTKFDYPNSILPRTFYKEKVDISDLIKKQQVVFVRRSSKPFAKTFNVVGELITLKEDSIFYQDIPDLSLNLLGGKYQREHLKYKLNINSDACRTWDGKTKIDLTDFHEYYEVVDVPCEIYFDGNIIHDHIIPYNRQQSKELDKLAKSLPKVFTLDKNTYTFEGKIAFESDPLNLNYWHAETCIFDVEGHRKEYTGARYIKQICEDSLRNVICKYTSPIIEDITPVSIKDYWKNHFVFYL
mgnify:CR=1 FL=1